MANIALEVTSSELGHTATALAPRRIQNHEFTDLDLPVTSSFTLPPPGYDNMTKFIAGRVKDRNNAPVEGATVMLFRESDNYMCAMMTTNNLGLYMFARREDDTNTYYTVAYSIAGGTTQVHGTSDRGMVPV